MGRPKKEKPADDAGTTPKPRRIGLELPDSLTEEIADYCSARPFVKEPWVKDAVRQAARNAAEAATVGRVADIMAELLK